MNDHDRYVSGGRCPAISVTKAWCNKLVGHFGLHGSRRIKTPPPADQNPLLNPSWVEWKR